MSTALTAAANRAFGKSHQLGQALRESRSAFGFAPFSVEACETITRAVDDLIQARLTERDEQWIQFLKDAMRVNGIPLALPPTT